jgi:hypothetical protein
MDRDHTSTVNKQAQDWLTNEHGVNVTPWADKGHVNSSTTYGGKEYLPEWFLRYDQDAATSAYTGLATSYLASGESIVYSRDSWGDNDKFWMQQASPTFLNDHQTTGCGGFKLFKNGEFGVVENDKRYGAGVGGQTDFASYERSTIVLGTGTVTYQGSGSYLTGGFGFYGEAETCSIPGLSTGTTYAAWQSNLDGAYRSDIYPVSYVRRNFFHLKPITIGAATSSINYVVVIDAVKPTNSIAVTEQFYVPKTSPTVADPNVSFTLTNTKTLIRRIYPTGGTIASANVTDASAISDCIQCGSGMARVTNPDSASSNLHNLGVVLSMQGTSGTLPTTTAISGDSGNFIGVLIDDANVARIVLARKDNTTKSATTFTFVAAPSTPAEYVILGLTPTTTYSVGKVGTTYTLTAGGGTYTVDANGGLRWSD